MIIAYHCPALCAEPLYFLQTVDGRPKVNANMVAAVTDPTDADTMGMVLRVAAAVLSDMNTIKLYDGDIDLARRKVIDHLPQRAEVQRKMVCDAP